MRILAAAALLTSLAGPCLAQTGQYSPDLTRDSSLARETVGVAQGLASADRYRVAIDPADQNNASPYANLGIGQVKPALNNAAKPCGGRHLRWEAGRQEPCAATGWFSGRADDTAAQKPATHR